MSYQAEFGGWQDITLEDLIVAYRKAKADSFFENSFPTATKFTDYEQDLLTNLDNLLKRLKAENGFAENAARYLGQLRILPKKLVTIPKKEMCANGHVHFSDSDRAIENLVLQNDLEPEFRTVGDFPVDTHVLSALWINTIGHKFDSRLDASCYGARLRRIRNEELFEKQGEHPFHISAVGSFTPYFQPYQKWRRDGLDAIRDELKRDRDVIAVSLDLMSYYHFIDPEAISAEGLHRELKLELTNAEKAFTRELAEFLIAWSGEAIEFTQNATHIESESRGGLAIGLTASRIVSNVLLHPWDKIVKKKVAPIHYGRYVDDMFLVLRDSGSVKTSSDFMEFLQGRLGREYIFEEEVDDGSSKPLWRIQQGTRIQKNTDIRLQPSKQKLFVLHGRAGLDLLDSIEKEITELSSEHRLLPSPDQLGDSTAVKVLSAAGNVGESADTLRRADGLTIRRLSWALRLRHVETLAQDLPAHEWSKQRNEFYDFAHNHILRADALFGQFTYLPRLLGFAISLNEWQRAERIVMAAYRSLEKLATLVDEGKAVTINGVRGNVSTRLWRNVKATLSWLFVDSAIRHYNAYEETPAHRTQQERRQSKLFLDGLLRGFSDFEDILGIRLDSETFYRNARSVAKADLAKEPYKRNLKGPFASDLLADRKKRKEEKRIIEVFQSASLIDTDVLREFLRTTRRKRLSAIKNPRQRGESYLPYLFPTRPLTPEEISELAPECVGLTRDQEETAKEGPASIWGKYAQAMRGVWVKPTLIAAQNEASRSKESTHANYVRIGTERTPKVIVALTNLMTDQDDWAAAACGKPNLSHRRYHRICEVVNQTIRLNPRPDYVLFPELSLPLDWVDSVASRLSAAGISLIAGTEYRHSRNNKIRSEACLVLTDNRLGFPAAVRIWQPKIKPSVGEDKELNWIFGKTWKTSKSKEKARKPVYVHNDHHFGIMICSELQNSKARVKFQGKIDSLMVLSWNQDINTFGSLVESAALDTHAYTILVNNRMYGDSRVRSPAKDPYRRDIAQVRGGDNDFVIVVSLDIDALRSFQSRAKRWPKPGDEFKPLPENFQLAKTRKMNPPG